MRRKGLCLKDAFGFLNVHILTGEILHKRRKTANARERQRMHEVNVAFDKLKESIPHHKLNQVKTLSHNF